MFVMALAPTFFSAFRLNFDGALVSRSNCE